MKNKLKERKGITLIALVITIIVLLILAGVSIAMLTGENGILNQANKAKTETGYKGAEEKVKLSAIGAKTINNGGEITQKNLETELGKYFTSGKYNVTPETNEDGTEGYIVTITEKDQNGRKYFVSNNGNVTEYIEKEQGKPEGAGGTNFNMSVGAIEVEFLEGTGYNIGKANEPLLDEKAMIPIKYNGTNWVATTKDDVDWYNYDTENRKWANVMLSDGTYTLETVPKNQPLEESELGSMFVWIPRYAYKIVYFDNQSDKESYIENGRTDTSNVVGYSDARGVVDKEGNVRADITKNITGIKVGDNYRPHPVFENNVEQGGWDEKLTGIWVGKFETTSKTSSNETNMILPNKSILMCRNVSTYFNKAKDIGIKLAMTLDSHMMKNTEWGAATYLTESKYGRNGTPVSVNQCINYRTGLGRGEGDNQISNSNYSFRELIEEQRYNGNIGMLSSTTENIYGIYDMAGGSWEYVMGIYGTDKPSLGNTGFTEEDFPERKYYNLYTTKDNTNIGDALYETSGWNSNSTGFVNSSDSAFRRGGESRSYVGGIFSFQSPYVYGGEAPNNYSFRVCLAVQ